MEEDVVDLGEVVAVPVADVEAVIGGDGELVVVVGGVEVDM